MSDMKRVYLDNAATAPLRPTARQAVVEALDVLGNPSSVHREGQQARFLVEQARRQVAELVSVRPEQVVFTSGGSEANNIVLRGTNRHLLVSAIEHPSVLATAQHLGGEVLPAQSSGQLDLQALEKALKTEGKALVSVMHVNNETGVVNDVAEIAKICRKYEALFHTDAVQSVGKCPTHFTHVGADILTLSAHKFGGPKGVGALIVKGDTEMEALITGGGQERNRRAGTENTAAIAGMGAAAVEVLEKQADEQARVIDLRSFLLQEAKGLSSHIRVAGEGVERSPYITQFLVPGLVAEDAVIALDLKGIAVSHGSACSSGKVEASHVLQAMGYKASEAATGLRVSFGWQTTKEDVEGLLKMLGAHLPS